MKIISTILLFGFSVTFLSCNNQRAKFEELKEENTKLKFEIDSIRKSRIEYSYRAIVISKNNNLKLGEEYVADIRLSAMNKNNPPLVLLGHENDSTNEFIPNGDTLHYNFDDESAIYKITPKQVGIFVLEGEIISNFPGEEYPFEFSVKYNVIK